jgi:hypothetical protein
MIDASATRLAHREQPPASGRARRARLLAIAVYLAFIVAGFATPLQPRVFWTMLLPLLVLFIVLVGFHPWRNLCPLAALGELGWRLNRGSQRRVPEWLERGHLLVPFSLLATMLLLRLVATNGDGRWLAALLVALPLGAIAVNAIYTGKTWCNFFCPVGFIERIYTDPAPLARSGNSQCARCTACKKSCPDIDQENNYWRELAAPGRRLATYAFPGVVLAFYSYFWLRAGDWEAYFDGRWTRQPASRELLLGAGYFFAPGVPAVAAAALALAGFALASYALFAALEAATRGLVQEPERHRHLLLSFAAFAAFSLFYVFAGAPTLRKIPYGTRGFAFLAPAVGTLVLVRRWGRRREGYVREKGAAKLLRNWPFPGEPPTDPLEAYTRVQASELAREQLVAGYAQTLHGVLADGLVDESELRLLDELRRQFGITPREHERVVAQLAEDERHLLAAGHVATVEERLQLETYAAALTEALLRAAGDREIDALRRAFGISVEDHQALRDRLRSGAGPLLDRARRELEEARARRDDRLALAGAASAGESRELLAFLLGRVEEGAIARLYDLLALLGDADAVAGLRPALGNRDRTIRSAALQRLLAACPAAAELAGELDELIVATPVPPAEAADLVERLARLAVDADPFVRAGAVWGLVSTGSPTAEGALTAARRDGDALVREAADAARESDSFAARPRIARMQALRRIALFAELDPDDLLDVVGLAREEEVAADGVLCAQGELDAGDLFVVLAGRAAVTVRATTAEGEAEREIAELGPGEVVGELALLDGSPRSATVRPRGGPLRVLRIEAAAFRERLLPRGRVARSLLLTLTERLRRLSGRIAGPGPTAPPPGA